jgi:hypothetical protein
MNVNKHPVGTRRNLLQNLGGVVAKDHAAILRALVIPGAGQFARTASCSENPYGKVWRQKRPQSRGDE